VKLPRNGPEMGLLIKRIHGVLTLLWIVLLVPSLTIWKNSLLWVVFMSAWANIASHAAGWLAGETAND
jgi:hypothetical protein